MLFISHRRKEKIDVNSGAESTDSYNFNKNK